MQLCFPCKKRKNGFDDDYGDGYAAAAPDFPAPYSPSQPSISPDSPLQSPGIGPDDAVIFMDNIEKKLKLLGAGEEATASKCTIFQVPNHICGGREELFRPQFVSIGPYVHKNTHKQEIKKKFEVMEVVKWQFLHDLKMQTSDGFLEACVKKLRKMETKIRKCYYQSFEEMTSNKFIEIMLLDGIFIIQYFMKWGRGDIYSTIGKAQWNFGMILHDLLLLENQIPFFVLQALFDLFVSHNSNTNLESLTDYILYGFMKQDEDLDSVLTISSNKIKHLLHLYHHCYISKEIACSVPNPIDTAPGSILSATKLQEAGVKFKKKKEANSFLDVTFKNGVLEIPFVSIHDRMTYKFANLVSLEQSTNGVGQVMTSYAMFMDKIIDTSNDVEVLRYEGILENMLANNEDVALFFNQLCSYAHLNVKEHYLAPVFKDVDAYCKSRWHEQRAWLVRNYFSNAWVFISLVAAVILLILTFLQTYFSVYGYFRPP